MNHAKNIHSNNNKIFIGLLILTFFLPWPHGGELNWEYLPFIGSTLILLTVIFLKTKTETTEIQSSLQAIKLPLLLLSSWVAYTLLQALPLPIGLVKALNPNAPDLKVALTGLEPIEQKNNTSTLSIAPGLTLMEALKYASYVGFLMLSLLLLNSKRRIVATVQVMFVTSTIMALYSLINHYTNGSISIFTPIPPWTIGWRQAAHGSFSYQNHYASFLTLTIPLGFGLMYQTNKQQANQIVDKNISRRIIGFLLSVNGIFFLGTIFMLMALIKTSSRGGGIIFLASIFITSISLLAINRNRQYSASSRTTLVFLLLMPVVVGTGVTDRLISRYAQEGLNPNGRDIMQQTAISIIKEYPVFGSGAGTYPVLQQKFKAPELGDTAMSKRAHNDYLELLSNQGFIGGILLGTAISILFSKILLSLKRNNSSLYGIQIACFCSLTAILLHSVAEFNFQLPVNAVYFFLLITMGLKIPLLNKK